MQPFRQLNCYGIRPLKIASEEERTIMNTFSGLLSSFVHQKDISVYPMTRYCGVDRTLMYKYLNGKDYPKEQAVVERMGDFMRLSPSEYEDLLTAWKIEKIGWKNWNSRRNVEDFLLNFPDVSRLSDSLSLTGSGSAPYLSESAEYPTAAPAITAASAAAPIISFILPVIYYPLSYTVSREQSHHSSEQPERHHDTDSYKKNTAYDIYHIIVTLYESECSSELLYKQRR